MTLEVNFQVVHTSEEIQKEFTGGAVFDMHKLVVPTLQQGMLDRWKAGENANMKRFMAAIYIRDGEKKKLISMLSGQDVITTKANGTQEHEFFICNTATLKELRGNQLFKYTLCKFVEYLHDNSYKSNLKAILMTGVNHGCNKDSKENEGLSEEQIEEKIDNTKNILTKINNNNDIPKISEKIQDFFGDVLGKLVHGLIANDQTAPRFANYVDDTVNADYSNRVNKYAMVKKFMNLSQTAEAKVIMGAKEFNLSPFQAVDDQLLKIAQEQIKLVEDSFKSKIITLEEKSREVKIDSATQSMQTF